MQTTWARRGLLLWATWLAAHAAETAPPPSTAEVRRAAAAIPAAAFFGLPGVAQPRLSPDGTKIAFLFPHEGRMALGVFDRATQTAQMIMRGTDESLDDFVWKGNEHLVFRADFQGNESDFVAVTDVRGRKVRRIAESYGRAGRSGSALAVVHWLPADPACIAVAGWVGDDPQQRVVKLPVTKAPRENIFTIPTDDAEASWGGFVVDGQAQLRLATVWRGKEARLLYRDDNTAKFTELSRGPVDPYAAAGAGWNFTRDGRQAFIVEEAPRGGGSVHVFDRATHAHAAPFFTSDEAIVGLTWSADGNRVLGVETLGERASFHWLDAAEAQLRQKLQRAFPGLEVRVVSRSDDDAVRLVLVRSDREPGVYFVFDRTSGSLVEFKQRRAGLDARLLRPMEPIRFTARDGLEIHGYLTRPFGAEAGPVPLVLHPHGGPYDVRDVWGFDPEVQFLASRGYAVLQVNFRGSGGYGAEFLRRGRRQWGRAMQDDLTDAVRWAIAQGVADPRRVAIFGASYGGYAALAGAALTPDLYCCAVNYVGVADLEITGHQPGSDAWRTEADWDYRDEWIGATKEYRDATNPVLLVPNIRVPTLHAYGRNDPRVRIEQWERLEAKLKKFKRPYQSMVLPRAGHGFEAERDAIPFYETLERFLAEHLAPAPR